MTIYFWVVTFILMIIGLKVFKQTSSPFLRRTVDGKGAAVDGVDSYWIIEMRTTII